MTMPTTVLTVAGAVIVIKVTLLLTAAALLTQILRWRRSAAATRHLVWACSLAGAIGLPVFRLASPEWDVRVLPAFLGSIRELDHEPVMSTREGSISLEAVQSRTLIDKGEVGAKPGFPSQTSAETGSRVITEEISTPYTTSVERLERILFGVYAVGVLLVLLRLGTGEWSVRRLSKLAVEIREQPWSTDLAELCSALGIRRPVRLLRSADATMPMTWGIFRPVVLLPSGVEEWSAERRRVVLLHELAHVARRDCLAQTIASFTCALYWFHPLAWYAARKLRIERELACDDEVLAAGSSGKAYATHLLDVAHSYTPPALLGAAALTMARRSQLEGRLLAVLDTVSNHHTVSRRTVLSAVTTSILILVPFAGAHPTASLRQAVKPSATGRSGASDSTTVQPPKQVVGVGPERTIERTVAASPGGQLEIDLETGGDVRIVGWDRIAVSLRADLGGRDWRKTRVELTKTDAGVRLTSSQEGGGDSYSTSHHFQLRVPSRYNVHVRSNGGGVEIRNVQGRFTGRTNGGALRLAQTSGEARLFTNGGEITVTDSHLSGQVGTNGGAVVFRNVTGDLRGETPGGRVVRESGAASTLEGVSAPHVVRIPGGPITVVSAPAGADLHTGGGKIVVQSASRYVSATTGGGDIWLGAVDGRVNAITGSGDVYVKLLNRSAGDHSVDIHSGTGGVELMLPSDFDGVLDIETAYTNNYGRRVSIRSDFALRVSESSSWESISGGTPRKFVRGSARIGTGLHRVVIQTVNGDVTVRKAGRGSTAAAAVSSARIARGDPDSSGSDANVDCVGATCTVVNLKQTGRAFAFVIGNNAGNRRRAVAEMARHAPEATAAAALEALALTDSDAEVQREAVRELRKLDEQIALLPLIRIAISHATEEARREAVRALGSIASDDAVAALHRVAITDRELTIQREAVTALAVAEFRPDVARNLTAAQIRNILEQLARTHPQSATREAAARALEELRK